MNYRAYPTALSTPNRNQRKAQRRTVFAFNKATGAEARRAKRKAKKEANAS